MSSSAMKVVRYERGAPMWDRGACISLAARETVDGNQIARRSKAVAEKFEEATQVVNDAERVFYNAAEQMMKAQERVAQESKKASGVVRKAADELRSGLEKVQKTANFSALERQVELLERAAAAMTILADLEKSGRLDRIVSAIK